uniref:Uncharacterized protein n=1 Tax=Knipowitschia caucasica TaxID=637954 RepID=A0AAV2MRC8_KNICA
MKTDDEVEAHRAVTVGVEADEAEEMNDSVSLMNVTSGPMTPADSSGPSDWPRAAQVQREANGSDVDNKSRHADYAPQLQIDQIETMLALGLFILPPPKKYDIESDAARLGVCAAISPFISSFMLHIPHLAYLSPPPKASSLARPCPSS